MTFRNPYDFVPFESGPSYVDSVIGQERAADLTGRIAFKLRTKTPLCINQNPGAREQGILRFAHIGGRPVIPATSLKGVVRAVHEVVTNSTLGFLSLSGGLRARVPAAYHPHQAGARLTASEVLFGKVSGSGAAAVGYAGRVLLDDISVAGPLVSQEVWRPRGGQPKPTHLSFYFARNGSGDALGRKFYYHQLFEPVQQEYKKRAASSEQKRYEVVPLGRELDGELRFVNLSQELLDSLVYALVLEEGLAHKLGYGKPVGLGSVTIEITAVSIEQADTGRPDIPPRYMEYDRPIPAQSYDVAASVRRVVDRWCQRPHGKASYLRFTELIRWRDSEVFIYPNYAFFNEQRGSHNYVSLDTYQRQALTGAGAGAQAGPAPSQPPQPQPAGDPPPPADAPPPDPPRVGELHYAEEQGFFVLDDELGPITAFTGGANKTLLRQIGDRVKAGATVRVTYRLERTGETQLAYELKPEEGR